MAGNLRREGPVVNCLYNLVKILTTTLIQWIRIMMKSHLAYVAQVTTRAFGFWGRTESATSLVVQVLLVVTIFGTTLGIDLGNLLPNLRQSTLWTGATIFWLFVVLGYLAPKSLWDKTQQELDGLKDRLRPKLVLEFIPDTEGIHQATTVSGEKVLYVRGLVRAATDAHVRGVTARLQLVEEITPNGSIRRIKNESLDLRWANLLDGQSLSATIHSGDPKLFDIFRVVNLSTGSRLELLTWPRKPDLLLPPGNYRFTIAAVAEDTEGSNIPVEKLTLEINWDGTMATTQPRVRRYSSGT